jgi:hypothetical protein
MRTSGAATQLLSDLNFAREMAQRTGVPHYVDATGGSLNYTVKRAAAPPAIQPGTDPVVRQPRLGDRLPGVGFSLNGATADPYGTAVTTPAPTGPLVFNARGLPSTPAAFFVASTDGKYTHSVSVTGAGRIRVFTRTGATWR